MARTVHRPGIITFLSVLGVIQGVVTILLGVFVIVDRDDEDFLRHINETEAIGSHQVTADQLLAFGIIAVVLGAVGVAMAIGLSRGSTIVRWLLGIGAIGNAGAGLYALTALHGEQRMSGVWSLVIGVLMLWILFGNRQVDEFFEGAHAELL